MRDKYEKWTKDTIEKIRANRHLSNKELAKMLKTSETRVENIKSRNNIFKKWRP